MTTIKVGDPDQAIADLEAVVASRCAETRTRAIREGTAPGDRPRTRRGIESRRKALDDRRPGSPPRPSPAAGDGSPCSAARDSHGGSRRFCRSRSESSASRRGVSIQSVDLDDDATRRPRGSRAARSTPSSDKRRLVLDGSDAEVAVEQPRHQGLDHALRPAIAERTPVEVVSQRSGAAATSASQLGQDRPQPFTVTSRCVSARSTQSPTDRRGSTAPASSNVRIGFVSGTWRRTVMSTGRRTFGRWTIDTVWHRMARPRRSDLDRLLAVEELPERQRRSVRCDRRRRRPRDRRHGPGRRSRAACRRWRTTPGMDAAQRATLASSPDVVVASDRCRATRPWSPGRGEQGRGCDHQASTSRHDRSQL